MHNESAARAQPQASAMGAQGLLVQVVLSYIATRSVKQI
jgi:hypothetical protein